jgi:hypothetical protein
MKIYEEFEMLTFGNVPTAKVEIPVSVPIPTPFIPNWIKWLLAGLVVFGVVLLIIHIRAYNRSKHEKMVGAKELESLKKSDEQKSRKILKRDEALSVYKVVLKDDENIL